MNITCIIHLDFPTKKQAEKILSSIKVDDYEFVNSKITGTCLEATITSNSLSSLIHTLDDYLSCISVAEKIVNKN